MAKERKETTVGVRKREWAIALDRGIGRYEVQLTQRHQKEQLVKRQIIKNLTKLTRVEHKYPQFYPSRINKVPNVDCIFVIKLVAFFGGHECHSPDGAGERRTGRACAINGVSLGFSFTKRSPIYYRRISIIIF